MTKRYSSMRVRKRLAPFGLSQESRDRLRDVLPIKIRRLRPILDKVHEQFPLATKTEITQVVKSFFEEMRDQALAGNIVWVESCFTGVTIFRWLQGPVNCFKLLISTAEKFK